MAMRVLTGRKFNLLERVAGPTVSDQDANFPPAGLADGRPGNPFRFGTNSADRVITYDLSEVVSPGFEGWPGGGALPKGWSAFTTGSGTVAEGTGSQAVSGSGLKVGRASGSDTAYGYQDLIAFPGEQRTIDGKFSCGGTAPKAIARLLDLRTGKWLKGSDLTWQSTMEELGSTTNAASFDNLVKTFTVGTYEASKAHSVILRLILEVGSTNGFAYFDDWFQWADWTFFSVHGHNIDLGVNTIQVQSSTDNFAASSSTELTILPPMERGSFYSLRASPVHKRWARVRYLGTNHAGPILNGEMVLGKELTLAQPPDFAGLEKRWAAPQVRGSIGNWSHYALGLGGHPPRTFRMSFRRDAAAFGEWYERVFLPSADGSPAVIVPDDSRPDVLYGRFPAEFLATVVNLTHHDSPAITFEELALPMLVP